MFDKQSRLEHKTKHPLSLNLNLNLIFANVKIFQQNNFVNYLGVCIQQMHTSDILMM